MFFHPFSVPSKFVKVVENQKKRAENVDDDNDMIDAFVACGGQADKSGHVRRETMIQIIKFDFGLTVSLHYKGHSCVAIYKSNFIECLFSLYPRLISNN